MVNVRWRGRECFQESRIILDKVPPNDICSHRDRWQVNCPACIGGSIEAELPQNERMHGVGRRRSMPQRRGGRVRLLFELGTASWRERGDQSVEIAGGVV